MLKLYLLLINFIFITSINCMESYDNLLYILRETELLNDQDFSKFNINKYKFGYSNQSALHVAATKDNTEILAPMLFMKADIHAKDNLGMTPLFCAIANGSTNFAKHLIQSKSDLNVVNNAGNGLVAYALEMGNTEIVKWLLKLKANLSANSNLIDCAALHDSNAEFINDLIKLDSSQDKNYGSVAMLIAVNRNNLNDVKALLNFQISADVINKKVETPIDIAIAKEYKPMVELLLKAGVNMTKNTRQNLTKFMVEFDNKKDNLKSIDEDLQFLKLLKSKTNQLLKDNLELFDTLKYLNLPEEFITDCSTDIDFYKAKIVELDNEEQEITKNMN